MLFAQSVPISGKMTSKPFECHEAACGGVKKIALSGKLHSGVG